MPSVVGASTRATHAVFTPSSVSARSRRSPSGPLDTLPRPITDAEITFTSPRTGEVQIVADRPGIPFFYWYQLLWVLIGAALTALVYFMTERR